LTLNVDGPYGCTRDFSGCHRLLLVAGGAGIGPCHAHFRHLHQVALLEQQHMQQEEEEQQSASQSSSFGAVSSSALSSFRDSVDVDDDDDEDDEEDEDDDDDDEGQEAAFVGSAPAAVGSGSGSAWFQKNKTKNKPKKKKKKFAGGEAGARVHLLWVAKDTSAMFGDPLLKATLEAVTKDSVGGRFSFSLYATQAAAATARKATTTTTNAATTTTSAAAAGPFRVVHGRPDLAAIFLAMGQWEEQSHGGVGVGGGSAGGARGAARRGGGGALVFASGPPPLLADCALHADRIGIPLAAESYLR
jgi:hypothetical protein